VAKDVVGGMEIDGQQAAARRQYRDRTYYFCSLDCLWRFEAEPAHYADPQAAQRDATRQVTAQPSENGPCVR
jgi:YHS domain-containing protein